MPGILKEKYHRQRLHEFDFSYRLERRTREIAKSIEHHCKRAGKLDCLDIGTADGLMLSSLNRRFHFRNAYGIDLSKELLSLSKDKSLKLSVGDAESLKFDSASMDIITAAAVIEHVDKPDRFVKECFRVLRKDGILVVTTPNPFFDRLAGRIGYLDKEVHIERFNLKALRQCLVKQGFSVVEERRFMLNPFFHMPLEESVERLLRLVCLDLVMTNQLIVGRKPGAASRANS
jgi:2-polyprenyl-3-methyl-5-hydroxy-6-metoxy-1,4-benzoquinol methylase